MMFKSLNERGEIMYMKEKENEEYRKSV